MTLRLVAALLIIWAAVAAAHAPPAPGPRDLCPVCGMLVSKYPTWAASVVWKDGHAHHFDGAKDLVKFLHDLPKYAPSHRREDIAGVYVTEFYGLAKIDARKAFYVVGSDVLGPMGHEPVPFASREDAQEFMRDHGGKRLLLFKQLDRATVEALDTLR